MKGGPVPPARTAGFTIVEVLVSSVVLILLVVMVVQLTNGATTTTTNSRKHLDADNQARLIFDRMASDFNRMVKRPDVDYIFAKQSGNDAMFFYSEAPAYYDTTVNSTSMSKVSLVGYRINSTTLQLERLGKGLTWDGAAGSSAPGGMLLLTYPSGSATPDASSTLAGNWGTTLGTSPGYNDGVDTNYHVLGDQTFRMEVNFLLTSGVVSEFSILNTGSNSAPGIPIMTSSGTCTSGPPTTSSGTNSGFSQGSRWYDTTARRGYYCMNATPGTVSWSPIGIRDLSAIVVTIAVLDNNSRAILLKNGQIPTATAAQMTSSSVLADATSGSSTAQTWLRAINSGSFASISGLPVAVASQVRVYQRYFYLNYK